MQLAIARQCTLHSPLHEVRIKGASLQASHNGVFRYAAGIVTECKAQSSIKAVLLEECNSLSSTYSSLGPT
jgi:hypothetical protein